MIDQLNEIRGWIQQAAFLVLWILCWWKGRAPERLCSTAIVAMIALDYLYHALSPVRIYHTVDVGHLLLDAGVLAAFGFAAVRANRMYPIWLLAAQIVAISMHFQRLVSPSIDPLAYAILNRAPSYLQLAVLAIGLVAHIRREKRHGPYRSWRESSPRSSANAKRS